MKKTKSTSQMNIFLKLLFVMLPFLCLLIMSIVKNFSVFDIRPVWGDEIWWHSQTAAVVSYGKPLGYYGYNGTHAASGTFGPWGNSVVYIVALFAKLLNYLLSDFGQNVLIWSNLCWMCFANFIFLLFTNPSKKTVIKLIFLYSTLFINHLYSLTTMSEIVRFALAVILAGLVHFLLHHSDRRFFPFILFFVAPMLILISMSVYIVFAAILPIWFYILYKNYHSLSDHKFLFFSGAVIIMVISTLGLYAYTVFHASPYVSSQISDIFVAFRISILNGFHFLITSFLANLKTCDLIYAVTSLEVFSGFISFFLLLYYLVIALMIYVICKHYRDDPDKCEIGVIVVYFMSIFLLAFIFLYNTSSWTLVRGINVALVFSLYLLCANEKPYYSAQFKKILSFSLLGIIPFLLVLDSVFLPGRIQPVSEQEIQYKKELATHIQLDIDADPWMNTLAYYGSGQFVLCLPHGIGINSMIDESINTHARYVILERELPNSHELLVDLLYSNHAILFEDGNVALLINNSFG